MSAPRGPSTMVLACGPEQLTLSAADLAYQYGHLFHAEEFAF